jgi:hypothetical protein
MRLALALSLAVAACGAPPPAAEPDDDGRPAGFTAATTVGDTSKTPSTVGGNATWRAVDEAGAPSSSRTIRLVETRNRGDVFNLLLRDEPAPADVAVSVKLRADDGAEDRGGGLVWRLVDERAYYLCRWNPLEKNLRAYRVHDGRRIQLQSVPIEADPAAWHELAVTMKGRVIEISFDGTRVLSCADANLPDGGRVGLWTKADARSSFAGFEAKPAK